MKAALACKKDAFVESNIVFVLTNKSIPFVKTYVECKLALRVSITKEGSVISILLFSPTSGV
jgi:hypothetical protein